MSEKLSLNGNGGFFLIEERFDGMVLYWLLADNERANWIMLHLIKLKWTYERTFRDLYKLIDVGN